MPRITTFLTFDDQAEAAAKFYVSIFPNSRIKSVSRYGSAVPDRVGQVMTVSFELDGQEFLALNGGPPFTIANGISLLVNCKTQAEIDAYWSKLSAGGEEWACGWLKDKFGVPWQITPALLMELIQDPDPVASNRAIEVMNTMVKIDIESLRRGCGLA